MRIARSTRLRRFGAPASWLLGGAVCGSPAGLSQQFCCSPLSRWRNIPQVVEAAVAEARRVAALTAAVVPRQAAQAIPAGVIVQAGRGVATFLGVEVTTAAAHQLTADPADPVARVRARQLLRILGCAEPRPVWPVPLVNQSEHCS